MKFHLFKMLALCVILTLSVLGCDTNRPGVTQTLGQYDMVLEAPTSRASRAAEDVLKGDYKFVIDSSVHTAIDGKVVAHTAHNNQVTVWVTREGDNLSKVTVQVDQLTDRERLSMEILGKIKEKSKTVVEQIRDKLP